MADYCLVAEMGVVCFVEGDPSASLRVTNRIEVRGHIAHCVGSGTLQPPRQGDISRCHDDRLLGVILLGHCVILSAAKNLDC